MIKLTGQHSKNQNIVGIEKWNGNIRQRCHEKKSVKIISLMSHFCWGTQKSVVSSFIMNRDEFELEKKLRSLSVSEDSVSTNNEREHELAELIANCVADVEPRDNQKEEKKDLSSGENKESELLATSLIVTNLPNELFFQQELKVLLSSWYWMNCFLIYMRFLFISDRAGGPVQDFWWDSYFPLLAQLSQGQSWFCF